MIWTIALFAFCNLTILLSRACDKQSLMARDRDEVGLATEWRLEG